MVWRHFRHFSLILLVCCGCRRDVPPRLEAPVVELCDVPNHYAGAIRLRGVGRLTGEGLLLGDGTCPLTVGTQTIPKTILVKVTSFAEKGEELKFMSSLDSIARPLLQVVAAGELECREVRERAEIPGHGTGFGKVGLVSCRLTGAKVETMTEMF